jgi:hypothetical protein
MGRGVGCRQLERRHVKIFISRNTKGLPNGHVAGRSGKALPLHEQHGRGVESTRFSPIIFSIPALFYNLAEWPTIARCGVRR